jgi:ATP-dependent DNA ligase
MKLPPLYSRRSDGKVQIWEKEVDGNKHRSHSGIMDGEIVVAEWTVCGGKNVGHTNETSAAQQAMAEAKSEYQKKLDKNYKEDIGDIDNASFFEPMLAKTWQDYKDEALKAGTLFLQPKLDGLRLIASKDGLWTRNGKEFKSIPHIYDALRPLFKYNPKYIFDGEVYADKFNQDFNKICSLAKKTKPTKEDLLEAAKSIEYHIYDFPFWDDKFSERYAELKKVLHFAKGNPALQLVHTEEAKSEKEVVDFYEMFVENGYEGAMVRLDTKYEQKRTKNLLKYKEFKDGEYLILNVVEGVGNRSGGAGAIVCKNKDGSTFNSNIKGTREFCKEMLLKKDDYIGKTATIKYFNLTVDGVPRFPYFMGLRDE